MAMRHADYLLIGGGIASVAAARALRMEDSSASIVILCGEAVLPYQRPALTKSFLRGPADPQRIVIHPASFYAERRIDVELGARAAGVDPAGRIVRLDDGRMFRYGKLLIATGTSPRLPALPGLGLAGVHCLHSMADVLALREAAAQARRVVVLGAGFVGIEIAAALRASGQEVTLIERKIGVMPQLQSPLLSDYFERRCIEHGITVRTGCCVRGLAGTRHIEAVDVDGVEPIGCDLAIVAIGVRPNCGFLAGSGIAVDDGVLVDECLQSSDPDVFAAGDAACFFDAVFGLRRRIEHWDNALRQGKLAAANMRGDRLPYRDVSVFYGDVFDVSYNFLGYPEHITETVERGSLDARSYSLLYLKNDVLRAVFSLGRAAGETSAAAELIRFRAGLRDVHPRLSDPLFALDRLPAQTVLILQGGGALGAFECGAIAALEQHCVRPDVVSAVSIGAFNGAIVASHPGDAARALAAFWRELSIPLPASGCAGFDQSLVAWYVGCFGVPNFLRPRWWSACWGGAAPVPWWTSLYDATPIVRLIERYVDFAALPASPTRLLVSAVDVLTGEQRIFDSYADRLTPEHLLASGSLPPGMPWTMIDGRPYWDGGIVSNSPLDLVVRRCGRIGGRIFVLDLYSGAKSMPSNLLEVMLRRDEIVYMDRVYNDMRFEEYANDFSDLVDDVVDGIDEGAARRVRQTPLYIRLMGNRAPIRIARIALRANGSTPFPLDYDFSAATVARLQELGHSAASEMLARGCHGAAACDAPPHSSSSPALPA